MYEYNKQVHVLVIDMNHPLDDARIGRQIYTCRTMGFKVSRLHIVPSVGGPTGLTLVNGIKTYLCEFMFKNRSIHWGDNSLISRIIFSLKLHIFNKETIYQTISELNLDSDEMVIIHVHEPYLLFFALRIKKMLHSARIIYDRHEVAEAFHSFRGYGQCIIEKCCRKNTAALVVTCPEYCQHSSKFNNIPIVSIPNYPLSSEYSFDKSKEIQNPLDDTLRFVYIGSQSPKVYDMNLILSIAEYLLSKRTDVEFIIGGKAGSEALLSKYRELELKYPQSFKYIGHVSKKEAIMYTYSATFGFQLLCPSSPYYVATSSNKIYDYVQCLTIPIVRAVCPDSDVLKEGGLFFDKEAPYSKIISLIEEMCNNRELIASKRAYLETIKSKFTFENVMDNYIYLYESILSREVS